MATLKELVNKHGVTLADLGGEPSLAWDRQDEWQRNANGYRLQLRKGSRRLTFDFWQGIGCKDAPDVAGCLDCLLSDAQSGDQGFEEFCSEFGYDSDSRKAEKAWRGCVEMARKLKRFLGDDFDSFLEAERD